MYSAKLKWSGYSRDGSVAEKPTRQPFGLSIICDVAVWSRPISVSAELPVLVVIDEVHLTFNARDYAKTDKLYWETLTFLTQSRKVHTDVIFISQSVLNMDKQFMRLVQYIWRFRDLSRWKIPLLREFPRLEGAKTKRTVAKVQRQNAMARVLIPLGLVVRVICVVVLLRSFGSGSRVTRPVAAAVTARIAARQESLGS